MKRLLAIATMLVVLALPASPLALAEHGGSDDNGARAETNSSSSHDDSAGLPRLKTLADNEVHRRLGALNSLQNIVKNAKCLSASDRAALEAQIQAEQANLPTLKAKIDNDSDETTEKEDVKSIASDFRVFALMMPKVHLLRVADRLSCAITKITNYADKLQTHIDSAKAAGKDVTSLEATMADMRAQIKTANADFTSVVSTLLPLTPDQFNSSPSIVSNMKATLDAGRQAMIKALKDGNQIRNGLKTLGQV